MMLSIESETWERADGKVQTYCGLKLRSDTTLHTGPSEHTSNLEMVDTHQNPQSSTVYHGSHILPAGNEASSSTAVSHNSFGQAKKSKNATIEYQNNKALHICRHCSATMWYEERIGKSNETKSPTFSLCCKEGKIILPKLKHCPLPLSRLLEYTNDKGNVAFKQNIRVYNSMFCFTSFGARIDNSVNERGGTYTFRVCGQNYHRMGTLLPQEGRTPTFCQLYFHDTTNELKNRLTSFQHDEQQIDGSVVKELMQMLDEHSCVAKAFRMARDWCSEHGPTEIQLRLIGERQPSERQYNLPTVSEVAALVIGDFGNGVEKRDIVIHNKIGGLQRISELHPLYMALQYPLLFPYGEDGFHEKIPYCTNTRRKETRRGFVTMREYYSYRIQQRISEGTTLLKGGRLLQQYLVDAFTAVEEQRLKWVRNNQDELRADVYQNICDAVSRGDTEATSVGRRIVLPSTFTGSPRYMVQNYQDAMAICRVMGNPNLFITFTANPKWPEISEMLAEIPGQKTTDRPDVVTRLFKIKLAQLLKDIEKGGIFGSEPALAVVYTIEFQKRGLPHAHILLWLGTNSRCNTPADIDDIICAEIPCAESDPEGYKVVTEHMLHGPCGDEKAYAPCMIEGKCIRHFPKPFYAETTIDEDGFPVYQRRNNGVYVQKGRARLDNRFVVPYNRYLLLKYQSHINVEWCNRTRAIKYLFKYVNKGPDRATMVIEGKRMQQTDQRSETREGNTQMDEIKQYLDCRYVSPCEACWRIFAFEIHYCNPSIVRLSFHLPGQNIITLRDAQSLPALMRRKGIAETMFTQWFALNGSDVEARMYTYAEIPTKYVWNSKDKMWQERKQRKCIGRIMYAHPSSGERYYLRMLLNVVKGPRSFEEIRTVDGKRYKTFKQACNALGMISDDKEWTKAIEEAAVWASGGQLRELFVTILLFCEVNSPERLWQKSWEALTEDIQHNKRKQFRFPDLKLTEEQLKTYCLIEIEEILNKNGKSISDYPGLPLPNIDLLSGLDNRLIQEELSYNHIELAAEQQQLQDSLNPDQRDLYEKVITATQGTNGGFFFVNGAGGTGKTFLYKALLTRLRSERKIVLAVASSGIASLLLPGGRTAHSRFVIPIDLMEGSTCSINQNTHLAKLMHEVTLIIWDEAPMTQRYAFEALDRTLRDILGAKEEANRDRIFGGITVLLGGDFRQILPVIPKGKRQDIVQACINNSYLWEHCQVLNLSRNMRVNELDENGNVDLNKQKFNQWVLQVGDGTVQATRKEGEDEPSWIEIPKEFIIQETPSPIEELVRKVFPEFVTQQSDPNFLRDRAILTPLNDDADAINDYMFQQCEGLQKTYRSSDEICQASTDRSDQDQMFPIEFLNTLKFPGMPPHILKLKEGLPVMLLRNVNPSQGLCNGTRLIISHLGEWVVEATIITGNNIGRKVLIPRITLTSTKSKWPFVLKRRQFPIKPCYAMTINKSQGQSLNFVGIYLPKPVFTHGQLYVAISRVTKPNGLQIYIKGDTDEFRYRTRNIVYKEVFTNLLPNP